MRVAAVVLAGFAMTACSGASSDGESAGSEALADGQLFVCVYEDDASVRRPDAGPSGAASRVSPGDEFRVRYLVTEGDANSGLLPMTAVVVFSHTIPRVEQVHFPPPVTGASATFLRTEPGGFMLFQLDEWDRGEASFGWAQRDDGVSFAAYGRCRMSE